MYFCIYDIKKEEKDTDKETTEMMSATSNKHQIKKVDTARDVGAYNDGGYNNGNYNGQTKRPKMR